MQTCRVDRREKSYQMPRSPKLRSTHKPAVDQCASFPVPGTFPSTETVPGAMVPRQAGGTLAPRLPLPKFPSSHPHSPSSVVASVSRLLSSPRVSSPPYLARRLQSLLPTLPPHHRLVLQHASSQTARLPTARDVAASTAHATSITIRQHLALNAGKRVNHTRTSVRDQSRKSYTDHS